MHLRHAHIRLKTANAVGSEYARRSQTFRCRTDSRNAVLAISFGADFTLRGDVRGGGGIASSARSQGGGIVAYSCSVSDVFDGSGKPSTSSSGSQNGGGNVSSAALFSGS